MREEGKRTPLEDFRSPSVVAGWYYEVFSILSNSRQEQNPLLVSEILLYTNYFELIGSREEFLKIIQAADQYYLTHIRKENERQKH